MDGYHYNIRGSFTHPANAYPIIFSCCDMYASVIVQTNLCPFYEPENWISSLDLCCVCSSSMHPTCLCPYYEPKVHVDLDNEVVVAINKELSEAYILGDKKNLDKDSPVMRSVSISQHKLQGCKPITVKFSLCINKWFIFLISYLLFMCISIVNI